MLESKSNRIALYISAFLVVVLVLFAIFRDTSSDISLNDAMIMLSEHRVKKVIQTKDYMYLTNDKNIYKIATSQVSPKMFIDYKVEVDNTNQIIIYIFLVIFILGIGGIIFKLLQNKNIDSKITHSSSALETENSVEAIKSDVKFNDIGGISDVKVELEEIIDFMKNPKRYKKFGARMPRGVLLIGPPGVGKTMIAKAVANAADVPFYYQSGASFVQIYVGMGAKRVHELFISAKKNSPSIIFIDEIDAVGKKRDGQNNDEREATLNQLLTEMDGFEGSSGVIVIAATNKIEVLDSALLRAGRFDRRIFVELPTKKERESILSKYLDKIPNDVDIKVIANITVGFNGAALATLVNEAALLSLRNNSKIVTIEDFYLVKDKVMFGKKKLQMLNDKQKRFRVTYQAGKVISATYFDLDFEKLMLSNEKLTPISNESMIEHELESRIKMLLSGIVACEIKFSEHTSGVKDDLNEAKKLIKSMVEEYGMGSSLIVSKNEEELLMTRLYDETKIFLESMPNVIQNVENILYEKESIKKVEVKKYLDEIL